MSWEPVSSGGMACKLTLRWLDEGHEHSMEQLFNQDRITVGREAGNDCVLKDVTCVIGRKHAEIRVGREGWVLSDMRSINGTILNGAKIAPSTEYLLHDGDQIAVGPYRLVFQSTPLPATRDVNQEDVPSEVRSSETAAADAERLQYLLQRAYGGADASSATQLESHLQAVLRHAVEGYDGRRANAAVQALQATLGRRSRQAINGFQKVAVEQPHEKQDAPMLGPIPSRSGSAGQGSLDALQRSGEPFTRFRLMVKAVAAGLVDVVRARRTFQKEFEAKTTRPIAKNPNPIKYADSAQEIEAVLLDPTVADLSDEQLIACVNEVFRDMTIHHLGLMAGFNESIRGLLKELNPVVIAKAASAEMPGKGIGLFSNKELRTEAAAWRQYVQKHREFTEEEVKVFEHLLAPYFTKGYLAFHHAHKRT